MQRQLLRSRAGIGISPVASCARWAGVAARRANHFWFPETASSPQNKKYFAFPEGRNSGISVAIPSRQEGRIMIVTNVGRVAVDAGSADNERRESVRQRRVVLTSRCWCQVGGSGPASDGGKKADHRGDHVISRKAIAQGMSDVLRCPVCSCAHFLSRLRMRPRVQRASGIPCALLTFEGGKDFENLGRIAPREREGAFTVILRREPCGALAPLGEPRRMNRPQTGPSPFEARKSSHLKGCDSFRYASFGRV
jgi:hypothetical protein